MFSERSPSEIAELERQTREAPHLRAAQRALADDVTDLVHSKADREEAVAAAAALFGRPGPSRTPRANAGSVVAEVGGVALPPEDQLPPIVDVLERSGVVPSRAAARRAIAEGGAYLNNARVHDHDGDADDSGPAARALRDRATGQANGRRCHGASR